MPTQVLDVSNEVAAGLRRGRGRRPRRRSASGSVAQRAARQPPHAGRRRRARVRRPRGRRRACRARRGMATRSGPTRSAPCSPHSTRPRTSATSSRTSSGAIGKKIAPKTVNQKRYVDAIRARTVTFAVGPAGTGKTYLAMALAVSALSEGSVGRIIPTRPAVEAGASGSVSCPATCSRRSTPICGRSTTPCTTCSRRSGSRGTWSAGRSRSPRSRSCAAARSTTRSSCSTRRRTRRRSRCRCSFLTRLGFGSKMVVTGDVTQVDSPREQALAHPGAGDPGDRRHRLRRVRERGRRPPQARAADRRGEAARRGDRHGPQPVRRLAIAVETSNRSRTRSPRETPPISHGAPSPRASPKVSSERVRVLRRDPRAEARAPGHRRGDGRTRVPARRLGRAWTACPRARRRRPLPRGGRRGVARGLLVHGLLHPLGYEHGEEMERREREHAAG